MAPSIELLPVLKPNGEHISTGEQFWNRNMEPSRWVEQCPEFLRGQSLKNISILSSKQEDFQEMTWQEAKALVSNNRIDQFQRSPLELRRYIQYLHYLRKRYGSILSFVQNERLQWHFISPISNEPFTNPADVKILYNDWPYGIEPGVTHLVVWVKFLLEDDAETGFLTPQHHRLIEDFVQNTFCGLGGLPQHNVIWFKNWRSLKSVQALEHFHVMLYQASPEFLARITGNDRPMCDVVNELL